MRSSICYAKWNRPNTSMRRRGIPPICTYHLNPSPFLLISRDVRVLPNGPVTACVWGGKRWCVGELSSEVEKLKANHTKLLNNFVSMTKVEEWQDTFEREPKPVEEHDLWCWMAGEVVLCSIHCVFYSFLFYCLFCRVHIVKDVSANCNLPHCTPSWQFQWIERTLYNIFHRVK